MASATLQRAHGVRKMPEKRQSFSLFGFRRARGTVRGIMGSVIGIAKAQTAQAIFGTAVISTFIDIIILDGQSGQQSPAGNGASPGTGESPN
jgi:hypothetical protein